VLRLAGCGGWWRVEAWRRVEPPTATACRSAGVVGYDVGEWSGD
jgi:hypothetical protein